MGVGNAMGDMMAPAGMGAAFGGPIGAGIGAGVGLANYFAFDRPKYQRQLQLAATTQRLNPWTHMQADVPGATNPLGSALGMGATGAQMGQNFSNAGQQNELNNAYLGYLKSFSPGSGMAAPTGQGAPQGVPYAPTTPNLPPSYLQYGGWYGSGGNP